MLKKIMGSLILCATFDAFAMAPCDIQYLNAAYNNAGQAIARLNNLESKVEALEQKNTEVTALRKDLDDAKKLLQGFQARIEGQNALIASFEQKAQTFLADASKAQLALHAKEAELNNLQKGLEFFCQKAIEAEKLHQHDSQVLAQLQESRNRIRSALAVLASSKTSNWEAAFVEIIKEELKGQP